MSEILTDLQARGVAVMDNRTPHRAATRYTVAIIIAGEAALTLCDEVAALPGAIEFRPEPIFGRRDLGRTAWGLTVPVEHRAALAEAIARYRLAIEDTSVLEPPPSGFDAWNDDPPLHTAEELAAMTTDEMQARIRECEAGIASLSRPESGWRGQRSAEHLRRRIYELDCEVGRRVVHA